MRLHDEDLGHHIRHVGVPLTHREVVGADTGLLLLVERSYVHLRLEHFDIVLRSFGGCHFVLVRVRRRRFSVVEHRLRYVLDDSRRIQLLFCQCDLVFDLRIVTELQVHEVFVLQVMLNNYLRRTALVPFLHILLGDHSRRRRRSMFRSLRRRRLRVLAE